MEFRVYIYSLFAFAAFCGFCTYWALAMVPAEPAKWEKLPRNVWLGVLFAAAGLAWCVPHSEPIAPAFMASWLIPIAAVCLWLSYQFLDYLFSRAFGGFLILLAHYLLYSSFVHKAPAKPFFSLMCYALGTLGIFFCGKPHLMRDIIRRISGNRNWRYSAAAVFLLYALASAYVAAGHIMAL